MTEQNTLAVVAGRKSGVISISAAAEVPVVREATTGQAVATLQRVWAVAESTVAAPVKEKRAAKAEAPGFELAFYRKYTETMLRRYTQMSMESGRVPSMLGRSVLGGRASSYRIHAFDDAVIFRLDMEKCLRRLEKDDLEVVRRVGMQEYTQAEAAALIGICLRTCVQRYGRAMDKLTGILLEGRLLEPMRGLSSGRV